MDKASREDERQYQLAKDPEKATRLALDHVRKGQLEAAYHLLWDAKLWIRDTEITDEGRKKLSFIKHIRH